jgi:predicted ester cyclase
MLKIIVATITVVIAIGCTDNRPEKSAINSNDSIQQTSRKMTLNRDELAKRLIKAGELFVVGGSQAETDAYFNISSFKFHGPDSAETDYPGLNNYFKSFRAAFDDRSIRRGLIVVEGNYLACQTWIEGKFVREFTESPAGPLQPNGQRIVWDLINIFKFDDEGKLIEEWVRSDERSLFRQLGVSGK